MQRGSGDRAIVCVSSICGLAALGAPVTYSAAKAALNATVRGLARPLAQKGIRINAVAPGNILFEGGTWARKLAENKAGVEDMLAREVPLRRLGKPDEIADVVGFLASPRAAFITGTVIVADGGQLRA
jgi:3-oxoacyl-[acyl-carrier protein] reductase